MNRPLTLLLTGVCLASAAPSAHAGEKRLSEKQMPAPVLAAFHKAYPAATIRGLSVEKEHGKAYYEVESLDGMTRRDLSYLADGTVAEIEETIAAADLPAAVMAAVKRKHPGGMVMKAEKNTKGATLTYEILVHDGKDLREVVVTPAGKVLNEEAGDND